MLLVPWPTLACSTTVVALITGLTVALPPSGPSLLAVRITEFALAASAAYLFDDAAPALTGVAPQTLWRRRTPRLAVGLIVIACAWVVVLLDLRRGSAPSLFGLSLETAVLVSLSLATGAVLVCRGEPEPGNLIAPVVVLAGITTMFLAVRLRVEVFVGGEGSISALRGSSWFAVGLVALLVLALASRDPAAGPHPRLVRSVGCGTSAGRSSSKR
jgi:hypothetical protein